MAQSDFQDRNDVSLRNLDQLTFEDWEQILEKKWLFGVNIWHSLVLRSTCYSGWWLKKPS